MRINFFLTKLILKQLIPHIENETGFENVCYGIHTFNIIILKHSTLTSLSTAFYDINK
jgi:hypothetical protein